MWFINWLIYRLITTLSLTRERPRKSTYYPDGFIRPGHLKQLFDKHVNYTNYTWNERKHINRSKTTQEQSKNKARSKENTRVYTRKKEHEEHNEEHEEHEEHNKKIMKNTKENQRFTLESKGRSNLQVPNVKESL